MNTNIPQHHGRACFLDYDESWKYGEQPKKTELGLCFFPDSLGLEEAEIEIKRQFPKANWARLFDEEGKLWASFVL